MSGIPPCMRLLTEVSLDHLYFYFSPITPSQFKWPQIQFSSQQVLSVILQCTRVGRNCSKICFEVAMGTICHLLSWFSVALQYSFSCQMTIQETFQCQEKNRRERRKGLSFLYHQHINDNCFWVTSKFKLCCESPGTTLGLDTYLLFVSWKPGRSFFFFFFFPGQQGAFCFKTQQMSIALEFHFCKFLPEFGNWR